MLRLFCSFASVPFLSRPLMLLPHKPQAIISSAIMCWGVRGALGDRSQQQLASASQQQHGKSYLVGTRPIFSRALNHESKDLLAALRTRLPSTAVAAHRREMGSGTDREVFVYESISESMVRQLAILSVAQVGVCAIAAGLVVFHPQAASSALLPGWSFEGRTMLGGGVVAFGMFFAMGCKGFFGKQILRVAVLKDDPENLHVYTFQYPFSLKCDKVPRREFYAITAAYQEIDLDKESKESFIMPMYVGGTLRQTLIIDLRGKIHDKAVMHELLTKAAQELAKQGDGWGGEDQDVQHRL